MVKNNILVGITGAVGSGKSTVTTIIKKYGYNVLDMDLFSRQLIMGQDDEIISKLQDIMKKKIIKEGKIDLHLIGNFFDAFPMLEQKFEEWYEPYLGEKIKTYIQQNCNQNMLYFFEIPFLQRKGLENEFDYIWVIESTEDNRFNRVKKRNNYSDSKTKYLIQHSIVKETFLKDNIIYIQNNGSLMQLEENVLKELKYIDFYI